MSRLTFFSFSLYFAFLPPFCCWTGPVHSHCREVLPFFFSFFLLTGFLLQLKISSNILDWRVLPWTTNLKCHAHDYFRLLLVKKQVIVFMLESFIQFSLYSSTQLYFLHISYNFLKLFKTISTSVSLQENFSSRGLGLSYPVLQTLCLECSSYSTNIC